jgi:hypothetical protein
LFGPYPWLGNGRLRPRCLQLMRGRPLPASRAVWLRCLQGHLLLLQRPSPPRWVGSRVQARRRSLSRSHRLPLELFSRCSRPLGSRGRQPTSPVILRSFSRRRTSSLPLTSRLRPTMLPPCLGSQVGRTSRCLLPFRFSLSPFRMLQPRPRIKGRRRMRGRPVHRGCILRRRLSFLRRAPLLHHLGVWGWLLPPRLCCSKNLLFIL